MMRYRWMPVCVSVLAGYAAEPTRPPIKGIAHIALAAHDLAASRPFYEKFLGFDIPYSLRKPDGSPAIVFFKINDRRYIELSPEREPGTDRLLHIAFETSDAEGMRAYLQSKGIAVPDHVPQGRIGNLNFMIKDPQGHSVEIVQYPKDGWTAREWGKHMPQGRISKRMMHVGIVVTDLAPEMNFYEQLLGFSETWRGSSTGKVLSWINLKVPDGDDYVEFMLYKDQPSAVRRGTAHHLALEVPSVAASIESLKNNPYRERYSRPIEMKTGVNRKRQVNLFDPDGTRKELMESVTVDGQPAPPSTAPPPTP